MLKNKEGQTSKQKKERKKDSEPLEEDSVT